ncbi:MAG: glycosyltransferase [Rhodospirillales bacterium]|nr:glycosyltransferase [Rhodospirillales bacterium]
MVIRTALLTNFVPPYRLPLLQALQDHVGELKIFVSTQMEGDRPWIPDSGTLVVVQQKTKTFTKVRQHPAGFRLQMFVHFPYDTLAQLWRYAPEVVISGEFGLRTLQAAIHRVLHPGSRLIVWATLSEETEKGWGFTRRILRRAILKIADGVICNGRSGARYIGSFGFPSHRTVIVNQPVDVDMFAALPLDRDPEIARRLVFSGRLIPAKAVVELQTALKKWAVANPTRKVEMVWLGDGELRVRLERAELPANFTQLFHGNMPYAALPAIYQNCGALILPSLMDEWGLVVNEAMASGLVVLGSVYSQAAIEMVEDGENGWLIDPLRGASIEAALDELFDTPMEQLAKMRVAARQRAMQITPRGAAARLYSAINMVRADRKKVRATMAPQESGAPSDTRPVTTIDSAR